MAPLLSVEELSGGYHPRKPVLHRISFELKQGEMVGLIGLNGAGKSTTIKHILGLMQPREGRIALSGMTLGDAAERYRSQYAYVPENPLLYEELTVKEHLAFTARVYGLDADTYEVRMEKLAEEFQMKRKLDSFPAHLSKGMKQKVMVMCAFLAQPPLYIIDEPFVGLDPLGIRSLLERMVAMKRTGAGILMSSHVLSALEKYCDRFLVLHHGKLIARGTLEEICRAAGIAGDSLEEAFYALARNGFVA